MTDDRSIARRGFSAPRFLLDRKPAHGAPCTHCGLCCIAMLCQIGRATFKQAEGPCPALRWNGTRSSCGLVEEPAAYQRDDHFGVESKRLAAQHLIRAGEGCDSRFNGEPINREFHRQQQVDDLASQTTTRVARVIWDVTPEDIP